jgi:glycosyltransferase involved in cell wall biosynthesis
MILVNLSNLMWAPERWKRNQAIFNHLLMDSDRFEAGIFVQPSIAAKLGSFSFYCEPILESVARSNEAGKPITVLEPSFSIPRFGPEKAVQKSAAAIAKTLVADHVHGRPFLLWINSLAHYQGHIAEHLGPLAKFRIFDGAESFLMYERSGNNGRANQHREILQSADAVLCVNEYVMTKIQHPVKQVFPSCTEFADLQQPHTDLQMPPLFPKQPGVVYIGFSGVISEDRIDIDLLHSLFLRFSFCQFLFIGTTNEPSLVARLKAYSNFHFIPEVPHSDMAAVIQSFDAAIVPLKDNESTRGGDLLNILDYLACGVPVVSVVASNLESYGKAVYVAGSMWEFGNLLERVVTGTIAHNPETGREIAREQSWSRSIPVLLDRIFERAPVVG